MKLWEKLGDQVGKILDDVFVPEDVRAFLDEGRRAYLSKDYPRAIRCFREANKRRADIPEAHRMLGEALRENGELAEASVVLTAAREQFPQHHAIALSLARCLVLQGDTRRAQSLFRDAFAEPSLRAEACIGLGELFQRDKEHRKAIREYRRALRLLPADDIGRDLVALRLGETYAALGDETAIGLLRQAAFSAQLEGPPRIEACTKLSEFLKKTDDPQGAVAALEEAVRLSSGKPALLRALAAAKKHAGDSRGAQELLEELLRMHPEDNAARNLWGTLLRESGDNAAALEAFQRVLAKDTRALPVYRNATRAALSLGDWERAATLAEPLLRDDAQDVVGRAGKALGLLRLGDARAALAQLEALGDNSTVPKEALLAKARLGWAEGRQEEAIASIQKVWERSPNDHAAYSLLREIHQSSNASTEITSLVTQIAGLFSARREGAPWLARIEEARLALDQPMLLVVMGEFNAGKSTFVNALVGENIAKTGVTPTTATINVLRYGTQRVVRIWWQDGRSEDLSLQAGQSMLTGLAPDIAKQIERVEFFVPNPALEKVHLVDSPGVNSLLPEHEEVTRRFVSRADAVIWLFDIGQAGKSSERDMLEIVHGHKTKTLGVVNKIDRASEEEREQVLGFLRREFAPYFEHIVGVSARLATSDATAESGFAALQAHLEAEYFARSRAIVAASVRERLRLVVREAEEQTESKLRLLAACEHGLASFGSLRKSAAASFSLSASSAASALGASLLGLSRSAAEEILDFVRPQRSLWSTHEVDPEDSAYLRQRIEEQLEARVAQAWQDIASDADTQLQKLLQALADSLSGDDPALVAARARVDSLREWVAAKLHELKARVFERFLAFSMGYLQGGRLDQFFGQTLKKLDLDVSAIEQALQGAFAVETEHAVTRPLLHWSREVLAALQQESDKLSASLSFERALREASWLARLQSLSQLLAAH